MAKRSKGGGLAWFVAGLTVGVAGAILFAPKSGKETRQALADAAAKGRDIAERAGQDALELGSTVLEAAGQAADNATATVENTAAKADADTTAARREAPAGA